MKCCIGAFFIFLVFHIGIEVSATGSRDVDQTFYPIHSQLRAHLSRSIKDNGYDVEASDEDDFDHSTSNIDSSIIAPNDNDDENAAAAAAVVSRFETGKRYMRFGRQFHQPYDDMASANKRYMRFGRREHTGNFNVPSSLSSGSSSSSQRLTAVGSLKTDAEGRDIMTDDSSVIANKRYMRFGRR